MLIQYSDQPQALSGTNYTPERCVCVCVRVYDVHALDEIRDSQLVLLKDPDFILDEPTQYQKCLLHYYCLYNHVSFEP